MGLKGRKGMTRNHIKIATASLAALISVGVLPGAAFAQSREEIERRQKTKNDWRNLAAAGGLATLFGLLKNDKTIMFAGAAGGLYSLHRYEQDRKSQSQMSRARAAMFSRSSFERNGRRYERRLVTKNGQKYYQFVRQ
jgi:hypothetical protein